MKRIKNAPCFKQEHTLYLLTVFMKFPRFFVRIILIALAMTAVATLFSAPFADTAAFVECFRLNASLILGFSAGSNDMDNLIFFIGKIVFWATVIATQIKILQKPENPIRLGRVAIINDNGKSVTFSIRFWIMTAPGRFLRDVHIHVYIQDNLYIHTQPRKAMYFWDEHFANKRGIHTSEFSMDCARSKMPRRQRKDLTYLIFNTKGRYSLIIDITGVDSNGTPFQMIKNYNAENIVMNARFAETKKTEKSTKKKKAYTKYHLFNNVVLLDSGGTVDERISPYAATYVIPEKYETNKDRLYLTLMNRISKRALDPTKRRRRKNKSGTPTIPASQS